jgi:hypothetical protein
MSSLFGLSNGYEQVGETPAPFQPPGTKKSNPLDLAAMKEGIASAAQGLAKQVGVDGIKKQDKLPEHLRPPSTTWDQKPGKGTPGASASAFQSGFQNTSPAGLGPGGVVGPRNPHANPYDDPSNAPSGKEKMNLGNKYAKSYSSANPPPRVTDLDDSDDESEKKPSFMDELGMDKEPTRKEKKKKLQKIAENPGILVEAAARGDAAEVRELIVDYDVPADACAPPKKTAYGDDGGSFEPTPLVAAVLKGHNDVVKTLLKHGANTEVLDSDGNRPLHLAAMKGYAEVARRLCKAKAEKDAPGHAGATPLHLACRKGRGEVVRILVEAGASLDALDSKGSAPLHAAAAGGYEDVAEFLIAAGADPTRKDARGKTAKSVAAKKGYDGVAKVIKRAIREKREEEEDGSDSDA